MGGDIRQVLLLADFGPRIGGGHAMRCLSLGAALTAQGARVAMAAPPGLKQALKAFWPDDVEQVDCHALLPQGPALADAWRADLVVVDHYRAEARYESALARPGRSIAVIDDLADRAHQANLVLDPGFGRQAEDYATLAPGARILIGPSYALLRPDFAKARPVALMRAGGRPERLLISLGLTDLGGVSGKVASAVIAAFPDLTVDVVLGAGAESLSGLRVLAAAHARLRLHVDLADMAGLMSQADLAIGAGGSSVWERTCLGLPSLTVILADNQAVQAQAMDSAGLTLAVEGRAPGLAGDLIRGLRRLMEDEALRGQLSARSAALCDGRGAERAARAMLELGA